MNVDDLLAAIGNGPSGGEALTREEWEKRHADGAADLQRVERAEQARRALRSIPTEFGWLLRPGWQKLLAERCKLPVAAIKAALESTGDVLLRGASGVGKTSLACAILKRRIDAGARGIFVSTIDATHAHRHQERSEHAWKAYRAALESPLVLLDDIGFELAGGNAAAVCELVGKRRTGFANVWTTALTNEQIAQHYGDGVRRRLTENGRVTVVELG